MNEELKEIECCPPFNPEPWDGKVFTWENKKFIKDKVFTFFYIPINFAQVMKRLMGKAQKGAVKVPDYLCLSDHISKWQMDVYLAVDQEVLGAQNTSLSGKFLTKVYEGDFKETGKWGEDFAKFAQEKDLRIKKWYMWYTTCPKCAKKYGKNYTVIVGQVE